MCVCVKTFSTRYEVHCYDLKQLDFLNKRESKIDQSKVKPYFTRA